MAQPGLDKAFETNADAAHGSNWFSRWLYRTRSRLSTRLTRKLHVAFGALLLITLALAWYFYDSVKWYEHDLQQMALANEAMHDYQFIASRTLRMIGDLDQTGGADPAGQPGDPDRSVTELRQAVESLRLSLTKEIALQPGVGQAEQLARLAELERVLESVIGTHQAIHEARRAGRNSEAAAALQQFRNNRVEALFTQMIESELELRRQQVRQAHQEAVGLAIYITGFLPVFVTLLTLLIVVLVWFFSRSLTRSVHALREGAIAFRSGNLEYRIPELREKEFRRLGEGFNRMARELADHRARLHDTNIKLEAMVEERTRALQSSNERLAGIDDNRRKLLADISHEFRTPLTVIQGEAEIALRSEAKTKADYRDSLSRIMEQAEQTTRLVDDLLFIARAEVGEPRLMLEPVSVSGILSGVCEDFDASAQKKNIRLELDLPEDECVLRADAGRLRQVFAIVLDNALRYSHEDGAVAIGLQRSEQEVEVTVSDEGIGLSEGEAHQVFERFYRGSRASQREDGSGLGLPVARAIVEAHGGRIVLEPGPERGTLARITLPSSLSAEE